MEEVEWRGAAAWRIARAAGRQEGKRGDCRVLRGPWEGRRPHVTGLAFLLLLLLLRSRFVVTLVAAAAFDFSAGCWIAIGSGQLC
jgi:hypothetical protein